MRRLPVFLPMQNCPRRCIYCDQNKITGVSDVPSPKQVANFLETMRDDSQEAVEICYFGGSFTCLPHRVQEEYLNVSLLFSDCQVRLSTHPSCVDGKVASFLSNYSVSAVELGISSLDDDVLIVCERDYSAKEALESIEALQDRGLYVGAQLMAGLPGQTRQGSMEDLRVLGRLGPMALRIYPAIVLPGTRLEAMWKDGSYVPLGLDEAVAWCGDMIYMSRKLGFELLRTGLADSVSLKDSAAAGPYCPSFGELAQSRAHALELAQDAPLGPWKVERKFQSRFTGHGGFGFKELADLSGLSLGEVKKRVEFI